MRKLARSIGMGGTASPLAWLLCFDPIVELVGNATGVRRPTYVDDMTCLTCGAGQTVRAFSTLLFAGHAAGLLVKVHRCRWLVVRGAGDDVMAVLRDLPVECTRGAGMSR